MPIQAPSPSANLAQLVLLGEEHSGRDEMNLAGHPFALLQAPGRVSTQVPIYYEWPRTLPDGKKVTASWRVESGAQSGMPGPNEELLYLVMLQLTREAADAMDTPREWPQVVPFSRGDVLQRLGWNDGPRECGALEMAFVRLNAVSISAKWAFYDARTKAPMGRVGFHILSGFAVTPEPCGRRKAGALPLSWWKWDDVVHASLLAGNVRSLALDFTLSLRSPTARRLFRLLEALRHVEKTPRGELSIGLFKLRNRLGMTPYKHASKVQEKLMPGIEELQSAGYVADVEWDKARDGSPMAVFRFGKAGGPQLPTQVVKGPETGLNRLKTASASEAVPVAAGESKQQWAKRMAGVFAGMTEEERLRLRDEARADVVQEFWERLEMPESPFSIGLWKLVERETT